MSMDLGDAEVVFVSTSVAATASKELVMSPVFVLDGEEVGVDWSHGVVEEEAEDATEDHAVVGTDIEDEEGD